MAESVLRPHNDPLTLCQVALKSQSTQLRVEARDSSGLQHHKVLHFALRDQTHWAIDPIILMEPRVQLDTQEQSDI